MCSSFSSSTSFSLEKLPGASHAPLLPCRGLVAKGSGAAPLFYPEADTRTRFQGVPLLYSVLRLQHTYHKNIRIIVGATATVHPEQRAAKTQKCSATANASCPSSFATRWHHHMRMTRFCHSSANHESRRVRTYAPTSSQVAFLVSSWVLKTVLKGERVPVCCCSPKDSILDPMRVSLQFTRGNC